MLSTILKQCKKVFADLLIIPNGSCPVCGRVLFSRERYVCPRCAAALAFHEHATCAACGRDKTENTSLYCRSCLALEQIPFDGGVCLWHFHDAGQQIIWQMKFRNRRALCVWAGEKAGELLLKQPWLTDCDMLLPVPLSPTHLKTRGYNQSALIARGIGQTLKKAGVDLPVENDILERRKDSKDQIGSTRKERMIQLKGCFRVDQPERIAGKNILLADDVITTGATLRECAETLRNAGAGKIYIVTCAG